MTTSASLCERCRWLRQVITGKGSRFLLCQLARADPRFAKYPPQPVWNCSGFVANESPLDEAGHEVDEA